MRAARLAVLFGLALVLGACGRSQTAVERAASGTTPATALAPPTNPTAPQASAAERQEAGLAPTAADKIKRINEDGTETVEETAGDSGTRNALWTAVASTLAVGSPTAAAATSPEPSPWVEGTNYTRLVPAQPTSAAPGQVEVLEFFWYGCPHCYALDPAIESWKKSKPSYIAFSRVPVMWSEGHRSTARLFYTLESMGKLDQLHGEIFKAIHVDGNMLIASDPNDTAGAERIQEAFVSKFGVSATDFAKAYQSFAVATDLQRADQLGVRYRIEGVPTFVINGKYVADVRSAGSPERLLAMVSDLAAQEHKR